LGYEGSWTVEPKPQTEVLPAAMNDVDLNLLFASCLPRLQRSARRMLRDPQDCEDILQDGLLLALRNLNQFQGSSKFSTWLYSIIKNAARAHLRKTKYRPQWSREDPPNESEFKSELLMVDSAPSPEEECVHRERSLILFDAMQKLPQRFNAIMRLRDLDGVDSKDAAQKLGITTSAIKTYLFRARRIVTQQIRQKCVPPCERPSGHDRSRFQEKRDSEPRGTRTCHSRPQAFREQATAYRRKEGVKNAPSRRSS